jgi:hypothetical protein
MPAQTIDGSVSRLPSLLGSVDADPLPCQRFDFRRVLFKQFAAVGEHHGPPAALDDAPHKLGNHD